MANDSMRGGPRGSSEQAPWLRPTVFTIVQDTGGGAAGSAVITKANADDDGYILDGNFGGGDWQVVEVRLLGVTTFVAPDCEFDLGVAADPDCIVDGGASGNTVLPGGSEVVIPLNGVAPATTFGATNGRLIFSNYAKANAGAYMVQVLAKPVSGALYSD